MRTSFYDLIYAGLVLLVIGLTVFSGLEYTSFNGQNAAGLKVSLSVMEIVIPTLLVLLSIPTYYLFKRQLRKHAVSQHRHSK
jgi:hypothetical protein